MQLVPLSTISDDGKIREYAGSGALLPLPGRVQCLYIMVHPESVDEIAERFERWFADRGEVEIVDLGPTDKVQAGFIVMEWIEAQIDPLFLAILKDEEAIADFTVYGRPLDE